MLKRKPEPALHLPEEETHLDTYKRILGMGDDALKIIEKCISDEDRESEGERLQIIDLGGGNGELAYDIKHLLPKALVMSLDLSEQKDGNEIENTDDDVIFINDSLLNYERYIVPDKKLLLICKQTLHHLTNKEVKTLFQSIKQEYGIFMKDFLRPSTKKDLQRFVENIMQFIKDRNLDSEVISTIINTTQRSLHAAFSLQEIEGFNQNKLQIVHNRNQTYVNLFKKP